ncbi:MAG: bacillithiol biosynthesis deacetylase BshB1 [Bacteroidetes bacterium]|nr:bacillithiol biosynthesis deacetylase BshB1 [Bacteroidota bacterium]
MKVDILAFGAHPDDVEISCGGTILKHIAKGYKVGIIALTRGEMGTRGTVQIRDKESKKALKLLGASFHDKLNMGDGFLEVTKANKISIAKKIRKYCPDIVIVNAAHDRHPDHGAASKLVIDACFIAGLMKVKTRDAGKNQSRWRPRAVYHYMQFYFGEPDMIVNISKYMDRKMEVIKAYKSQFHDSKSKEASTLIAKPGFLEFIKARNAELGLRIGTAFGEGFKTDRQIGIDDLMSLE